MVVQRQWYSMIMSLVIIVINISCAIFVSLYIHEWRQASQTVYSEFGANLQLCLPWDIVKNGTHDAAAIKALSRSTVAGKEMCCASNSEQASTLMYTVISATDYTANESFEMASTDNFSISKASAHLHFTQATLTSQHEPIFLEDQNINLMFNNLVVNPLTEHVRNVDVYPTAMVVKEAGMYFIYSNVFFRPLNDNKCKDLKKQIWEHNIYLTRNSNHSQSGHIFNTTYKCCDECTDSRETSYIGGSLELLENDRLHVEVSSDGVVSFDEASSYFGLFMLN